MKTKILFSLIISASFLIGHFSVGNWKTRLFHGDSSGYYLHVVSFLVNGDVGDYDSTITEMLATNPSSLDPREIKFGIRKTEKGRSYIKYSLGVAMMETPFFLLAHAYAKGNSNYSANGWSLPYLVGVNLSIVFYVLLGLFFLGKVLAKYFSEKIVLLTLFSIAIATNLYYQATSTTMAHGFLFFNFSLLLFLSSRFYESPNYWKAIGIGAVIGLITITRIPEIVGGLIPILWGIHDRDTLNKRVLFFKENYLYILYAMVSFFIVFSPQIFYWHYVSGQLVFNPYQGEGFNFLKPNVLNGWFNYSNGWLVYTPIMAFSLIGWFFLKRYCKVSRWAVFSFVFMNVWIHYSYYVWNYFPGLGSRPMVETYPCLAFGLAAFYRLCEEKKWSKWLPIPIILFFSWLNLLQTWQTKEGIIWSQRSNTAFFWETFGMTTPTINSLRAYDSKEFQPDTATIDFIKTLHFENFEDTTRFKVSKEIKYAGKYALFDPSEFPNCKKELNLKEYDIQPKDWIYLGLKAYRKRKDGVRPRVHLELLTFELFDKENKKKKKASIPFATQIGNTPNSIWHKGSLDRWGESGFFVRIPRNAEGDWTIKIQVWNPHLKKIHIDDFHIEHFR